MRQPDRTGTTSTLSKIILMLVLVGILLAALFGFHIVDAFMHIHRAGLHPGKIDVEAVRDWMTVPYIARIYRVPSDYIYRQIGIPEQGNDLNNLTHLNDQYFHGQQGVVLQKVQDAIRLFYKDHPTPHAP
jgi:hypothetical protein